MTRIQPALFQICPVAQEAQPDALYFAQREPRMHGGTNRAHRRILHRFTAMPFNVRGSAPLRPPESSGGIAVD